MAETFCFVRLRISDLIFCFRFSMAASSLRKCRSCIFAKTERNRKTKVSHSPSVAPRQLPLGGSLWLCAFFLCAAEEFSSCFFGAFQTIPHPLRGSRPLHKGAMRWCDFFLCTTEKTKPLRQPQQPPFVKGGCSFVKATAARADTVSANRFSDFSLPQAEGLPFFRLFLRKAKASDSVSGSAHRKCEAGFGSPCRSKCLRFSESRPRPYTCAAPPARSHCRRHSDSSPESPRPFCRLPDRSR